MDNSSLLYGPDGQPLRSRKKSSNARKIVLVLRSLIQELKDEQWSYSLQKMLLWVNFFTLVAIVIYTVISFGQWQTLGDTIGQTQQSLRAIRRQTVAAEQELLRSHRPWVGVVKPIKIIEPLTYTTASFFVGSPPKTVRFRIPKMTIEFMTKNSGTSASRGQQHLVSLLIDPPSDQIQGISCLPTINEVGAFLLPNEEEPTRMRIQASNVAGQPPPAARLRTGIFLKICITYTDEFRQPHATGLMWEFRPKLLPDKITSILEQQSGTIEGEFVPNGVAATSN
jgi:hypothetical protein